MSEHWEIDSLVWYGPVPFGMAVGGAQYVDHFLRPLVAAFTRRTVDVDVLACEGAYCAAHGVFSGVHAGEWLGLPPSGARLEMDFGMHWHVEGGKIVEGWAIFDLPKMLLPIGVSLLPSTGTTDASALTSASARASVSAAAAPSHAAAATVTATTATATAAATAAAAAAAAAAVDAPAWTDNSCSNAYTKPPPGGTAELDCPSFVISSTDATWHPRDWAKTNAAVDTYFAEDWQSVRAFGLMLHGREALRDFMRDWLGGFPDVFIHVADVFCEGTDTAGYKTTMPYVLTATHTGWSKAFGAPTGNAVKYHGIANWCAAALAAACPSDATARPRTARRAARTFASIHGSPRLPSCLLASATRPPPRVRCTPCAQLHPAQRGGSVAVHARVGPTRHGRLPDGAQQDGG